MKNLKLLRHSSHTHALVTAVLLAVLLGGFVTFEKVNASITNQMDIGTQGIDVSELQRYYSKNPENYPSGLVTGYFGELSQSATEKFQTNQGIVSEGTPESSGYGRVGPQTIDRLNSLMGYSYMLNPTASDRNAPRIYPYAISVDTNSATISWITNENAHSRVMFGTEWPFLYATARSITATGFDTTARITLPGLQANTEYFFVRESIDVDGNLSWTTHDSFTTK